MSEAYKQSRLWRALDAQRIISDPNSSSFDVYAARQYLQELGGSREEPSSETGALNFDMSAELSKLRESDANAHVEQAAVTPIGTKWLKLWTYFFLPLWGATSALAFFLFESSHYFLFALAYFHFYLAYWLHHRSLEAWRWNWGMIVLVWIGAAVPVQFGSPLDFGAKFVIVFLVLGIIWMWPNYVYWRKRRALFQEGGGQVAGPGSSQTSAFVQGVRDFVHGFRDGMK